MQRRTRLDLKSQSMMFVLSKSNEMERIPLRNGLAPACIVQFKAWFMDAIVHTSFAAKLF